MIQDGIIEYSLSLAYPIELISHLFWIQISRSMKIQYQLSNKWNWMPTWIGRFFFFQMVICLIYDENTHVFWFIPWPNVACIDIQNSRVGKHQTPPWKTKIPTKLIKKNLGMCDGKLRLYKKQWKIYRDICGKPSNS